MKNRTVGEAFLHGFIFVSNSNYLVEIRKNDKNLQKNKRKNKRNVEYTILVIGKILYPKGGD